MGQTRHLHPVCRGSRKSRAIPLLTLRAFVVYKKGETYLFGLWLCYESQCSEVRLAFSRQMFQILLRRMVVMFQF